MPPIEIYDVTILYFYGVDKGEINLNIEVKTSLWKKKSIPCNVIYWGRDFIISNM